MHALCACVRLLAGVWLACHLRTSSGCSSEEGRRSSPQLLGLLRGKTRAKGSMRESCLGGQTIHACLMLVPSQVPGPTVPADL